MDQLGAAEVLREVVDLDHALAQRFLLLPLRVFICGDEALVLGREADVGARMHHHFAFLHCLAQLLIDRFAGDGGDERRLEPAGRVVAVRHIHAGGQAVAGVARLQRDSGALAVARVERRAPRRAEREDGEAQKRGERLDGKVREDRVDRLLRVI